MSPACAALDECRVLLAGVFDKYDVLLVPCVPGEAPKGLGATGDPSMQAIWTALHTPTMTLPTHRGPNNLPVGIQLVAQRYDDDRLFACARWIWDKIGAPEMVRRAPELRKWNSTIRSTCRCRPRRLGRC